MADLTKKDDESLKNILIRNNRIENIPKSQGDIYLCECTLAHTTKIEKVEEVEASLKMGDKMIFYRELEDSSDHFAIRVETVNKIKLGYIPRQSNIVIARLMDAGKMIYGELSAKKLRGRWMRMNVKIFLHEV